MKTYKSEKGYYYKVYKNGKKIRISYEQYKKYNKIKKIQKGGNFDHHRIELITHNNNILYVEKCEENKETKCESDFNTKIQEIVEEIGGRIKVVMDYHNVLDTIDKNEKIFDEEKFSIICCSYINPNNIKMRKKAIEEIQERIRNRQIQVGFLVFVRGKRGERGERGEICISYGSKAYICEKIGANYFIDDGEDHISSVDSLGINSYLIKSTRRENVKNSVSNKIKKEIREQIEKNIENNNNEKKKRINNKYSSAIASIYKNKIKEKFREYTLEAIKDIKDISVEDIKDIHNKEQANN